MRLGKAIYLVGGLGLFGWVYALPQLRVPCATVRRGTLRQRLNLISSLPARRAGVLHGLDLVWV